MDGVVMVVERSMAGVWGVVVEAAPWVLVGLFFAGLAKWALPERRLLRVMGRRGWVQVVRATVVGAPLPLCSCGVLPAALGLRREGLTRAGTASFLVATPQNGADSVALSSALLGPLFTVVRVVSSLVSALTAGFVTLLLDRGGAGGAGGSAGRTVSLGVSGGGCCGGGCGCSSEDESAGAVEPDDAGGCCGGASEGSTFISGQRYAFGTFLFDIGGWLLIGLLAAGLLNAWVDPGALSAWGSGLGAMLLVLVVCVPMYICAQASTPVAASMLAAGVSPGVVLVFLLAGPATNFAGVALVKKELGTAGTAGYLGGLIASALVLGLLTDWLLLGPVGWSPVEGSGAAGHLVPAWLGVLSAFVLLALFGVMHVRQIAAHVRWSRGAACGSCGRPVVEEEGAPA